MRSSSGIFPFNKVLVGVGGTEHDCELLRYASMLAESRGAMTFQFVHVSADRDSGNTSGELADAARFNDQILRQFVADKDRVRASCHVLNGNPLDRLLEFASNEANDLILLGHRRVKSGRRSMARRLAMKAPCSLWLAPAGSAPAITRVLVAVDFSRHSAHALGIGTCLVSSRGLDDCLAVNVQFNQIDIGSENTSTTARLITRADFEDFMRTSNLHGVSVRSIIEESSSVARAVLHTAESEHADLVVMGTRGRSASTAVLLGSETEEVIMQTAIPVLVVKQTGERASLLRTLLRLGHSESGDTAGETSR